MRCQVLTYQFLEDAWSGGVERWCRAASDLVLAGGEAWLLTANAGQGGWLKARLLRAGVALAGVRFPDAAALRPQREGKVAGERRLADPALA